MPGLQPRLQTAAAAKVTAAVVATEATATAEATAGALKVTAAAVVSTAAAVCRRGCKPGCTLLMAALHVHSPQ